MKMEYPLETPKKQSDSSSSTYKKQKVETLSAAPSTCQKIEENEIIDLSRLNWNNDENWLFECSFESAIDLQTWLTVSDDSTEELPNDHEHTKNIDTRTFTRPKKRFTRPSIEKYNEELYGNELADSGIQENGCLQEEDAAPRPVQFDLTQPISSSFYFDNVLANAPISESFQNMSPPSLVNSMCSSTFANLMDNSFIKNDPELREIRDMDFTGVVLQQEVEPMFQSITDSLNSLNLNPFEKSSDAGDATVILNATFCKDSSSSKETVILDPREDFQVKVPQVDNETIKLNHTFQVPEGNNGTIKLNHTFQRRKNNRLSVSSHEPLKQDFSATITKDSKKIEEKPLENMKRLLDRRPSPSLDLNRLSYQMDKNDHLNQTYPSENVKRNSIESSDSTENLDYMSLSSGSSKSSNKILSMDGINTIVEIQERGLQLMSTPKPKKEVMLWQNELSPISGRNSDPELSSTEKSEQPVLTQNIKKQKSMGNINSRMPKPQGERQLATFKNYMRGSQPNLKISENKPSLQKPSNLNSMGRTLKGSYTSLKPMNPNLPVAPPLMDTTVTRHPVAQVSPTPLNNALRRENAQLVKLQAPRSGLPRPVSSGIPRPVSKIPGPRIVRSAGQQGKQSYN